MLDSLIVIFSLIILLGIGIWSGLGVKTFKDYAISNQAYSTFFLVATLFATLIGAGSTLSIIENTFEIGVLIILVNLGSSLNKFLLSRYIVGKIARLKNIISAGDIMEKHYGVFGKVFTGLITIQNGVGLIMVQIFAVSYLLEYFFNLSRELAAFIPLLVIAIYTFRGGVRSVIATDVFQFTLFIIFIPLIFSIGLDLVYGYKFFIESIPADKLSLFNPDLNYPKYIALMLVYIFFSLDASVIQRSIVSANPAQAEKVLFYTAIISIPFFIIVGLNGLVAYVIAPDLLGDEALLNLINIIPVGIKGLVIAGFLAAIMSTIDSAMNIAAISASNDVFTPIYQRFFKDDPSDGVKLFIAQVSSIVILFLAVLMERYFFNIYDTVMFTYKFWAALIVPSLIASLYGISIRNNHFFAISLITIAAILAEDLYRDRYDLGILPAAIVNLVLFIVSYVFFPKQPLNYDLLYNFEYKKLFKLIFIKYPYKLLRNFKYTKTFGKTLLSFSSNRVKLHGAHYVPFGIFGAMNYVLPYFIWSHDSSNHYATLLLRTVASFLCFLLIMSNQVTDKFIRHRILPLYWHLTILFCLPLMATYTLFMSDFATTWLVNSALSIFITALLLDWLSFLIILPLGSILGFVIYALIQGGVEVNYSGGNLFLLIYLNGFALMIGGFFLYQKEEMIKAVIDAKTNLEELNANLEYQVKKRTEHLKTALNAKTEFLNNISHEIRTPLQGITGISTELAARWGQLNDQEKFKYIKMVADSGERLISLVSGLLDLSKFDSGKMLYDMEKATLSAVVHDVVDEMRTYTNKIEIIYNESPNLYSGALIDKVRIAQVIRNLIGNAIKFTEKGLVRISLSNVDISKWSKKSANGILFRVEDSGVGIPDKELRTIFQPFYQSSRTKTKAGGTGLGLAISYEIIHAHEGNIWAENSPNGGAIFSFIIPSTDNVAIKPVNFTNSEVIDQDIVKGKKVLFIDDEPPCLVSGELILQSSGMLVEAADGGEEALKKIQEQKYDVILLDLMMPDIYGLDVLTEIKKDPKNQDIPVILQSGASDNNEIAMAMSLGAVAHIPKPYNAKQMVETIAKALSHKGGY